MIKKQINIAQIGVGYRGPNLLRNLIANKDCNVKTVIDLAKERRDFVRGLYPAVAVTDNTQQVFDDPSIDAVVIATPVATHFDLSMAAQHGGRGYIDTHPVECSTNMMLDQMVFAEAFKAGVNNICFASSACVYPSYLQEETGSDYLLKEEDADPFVRDKAFADLESRVSKSQEKNKEQGRLLIGS
ncbi:MAG: Gfo/Idh/MocA family oxidoreductase [Desulfobacteraceae bacterium]|nr:Gfo/Idh/MocA family oxidoreductase [Desulfobacteraceae bacterium]